ncbi:hypothetical protein [Novosphingobium sp.]|uniref:hypothetical protein n=1 Tax=Novosphingobium sp. TaxID=1874826 RepID=UPI003016E0E9
MATPAEKVSPLRLMDWIWRLRGEVPLPAGQTADEALGKLEPLFAHPGTTHARMGDLIAVTKKDQLAQDPLSVVDSGVLHIVPAGEGAVLRYNLMSRALLWCFLAPLLFLGVAQLTIALGKLEKPPTEEKSKKDDKKKDKKSEIQLSPVDKFLGAPAPEKPKDEKDKDKKKKAEEEAPEGFSPTPAYVFAGIFAALYILGRILEAILIRRLFQRTLA